MKLIIIAVVFFLAGALVCLIFLFKIFVITTTCFQAQTQKSVDDPIRKECAEQEKLQQSELAQFLSGKLTEASESLKCYFLCIADKYEFFKDGKFIDEKAKEFYSTFTMKDVFVPAYERCKKLKGKNDCDTVYLLKNCIIKSAIK